ncbi:MAG: IS1634 family transposase [Pseudomonadota bacterium]
MHLERIKSKQGQKVYEQILLRESYREPGAPRSAVKKRTLLNLTPYPAKEIMAIEMALKYKNDLPKLRQILAGRIEQKQGPSVGAVWVLWRLCQNMGLTKALGRSRKALLTLWMVLARLIDQGSRLSAVRLAQEHAVPEVLGLSDFGEDDLYQAMDWLSGLQGKIEKALYDQRPPARKPQLFFYDVTSSYLEGEHNELADWGYNRDKKRGKKQIVIGLLCDEDGEPVSTEVFEGNTADLATFESQVKKAAERFGCERVTFVGDRGMIKSGQIENLSKVGFHYITAITKPQIRSLIKKGVFQLGLFDEQLCEIEHEGVRYVLRKNPIRAAELSKNRAAKLSAVQELAAKWNEYLTAHPRANTHRAYMAVWEKADRLAVSDLMTVKVKDRRILVEVDEEYLRETSELDGCYALKTDLHQEAADKKTIHDRYKDLAQVERAFRTMKTGHLEVRPVFVRKAARTRAHVFIVMLAYRLRLKLEEAWRSLDLTVEEGLKQLSTLCAMETIIGAQAGYLSVPAPRESLAQLFKALHISAPETLPRRKGVVDTKAKLTSRRK